MHVAFAQAWGFIVEPLGSGVYYRQASHIRPSATYAIFPAVQMRGASVARHGWSKGLGDAMRLLHGIDSIEEADGQTREVRGTQRRRLDVRRAVNRHIKHVGLKLHEQAIL